MDIESETRIEYKAITIFLLIIGVLIIIGVIGLYSNTIKLEPDSDALVIKSSHATKDGVTFSVTNQHSNNIFIQNVSIDGQNCQMCAHSPELEEGETVTVSCANAPHPDNSYQHSISIAFGNKPDVSDATTISSISGPVLRKNIGGTKLTPVYEKVLLTNENEIIGDVQSNACPQILVTGSVANAQNTFDLFLYNFNEDGQHQQMKKWNYNSFDTGSSIALTPNGKTIIYGHTYQSTQGADKVILTTTDYQTDFYEQVSGTAKSENSLAVFVDLDLYKYTLTSITDTPKYILIEKHDTNTEIVWKQELPLERFESFLTASYFDDKIHIVVATQEISQSKVYVYDTTSKLLTTKIIPITVRKMIQSPEKNIILVGEKNNQADSDASIVVYNQNWQRQWSQTWGDTDQEEYSDVVAAQDGSLFIVGSFEIEENNYRSFFHKYTSLGELVDSYLFRAPQSLKVTDVELTGEGIYAIGESYTNDQNDIYIAKFE